MLAIAFSPRFALGRVSITPSARALISPSDYLAALRRHQQGDWGELDAHDRAENERALQAGSQLFARYTDSNGTRFYIITEWDRSAPRFCSRRTTETNRQSPMVQCSDHG